MFEPHGQQARACCVKLPGMTQAAAGVPIHRQKYTRYAGQAQAMLPTVGHQNTAGGLDLVQT